MKKIAGGTLLPPCSSGFRWRWVCCPGASRYDHINAHLWACKWPSMIVQVSRHTRLVWLLLQGLVTPSWWEMIVCRVTPAYSFQIKTPRKIAGSLCII